VGDAVRSAPQDHSPEGRGSPDRHQDRARRPGPVRRTAAVAVAAGGAFSALGAAVPVAGPAADDQRATTAAFLLPPSDDGAASAAEVPAVVGEPPPTIDVDELTSAVRSAGEQATRTARRLEEQGLEEQRAREAEAAEKARRGTAPTSSAVASSGTTDCGIDLGGMGAVRSWVRDAAEFLGCRFDEPQVLGVGGRAGTSDHPSGLAADFMVDRATGDSLAACAVQNREALGISYVIWEQQINSGSGWEAMEDRGGVTANHFDHVHVSFEKSAPSGTSGTC
jgi:hypothetical protein